MPISDILYVVAGLLILYVIASVIRSRTFSTGDALAALGIVVALILAVTTGAFQSTTNTRTASSLASTATPERRDSPTPRPTTTPTPESMATETTPTPVPTATEAPPTPSPTAQPPQEAVTPGVTVVPVDGIGGEILEVSRFGKTLTIRFLLANEDAKEQQIIMLLGFSYLRDEKTGEKYKMVKGSPKPFDMLPAGERLEVWGQYEVPPEINSSHLTLVLQNNTLFQHIPIPTASR